MKNNLIIFVTLVLNSCDHLNLDNSLNNTVTESNKVNELPKNQFTVINYDDCEYLIYKEETDSNSSYGLMAHKGNCSNPIHCRSY